MSNARLMMVSVLLAGLFISSAAAAAETPVLTLQVIGPDGQGVEGVQIGTYAAWSSEPLQQNVNRTNPWIMCSANSQSSSPVSDARGMVSVPVDHVFWKQYPADRAVALFAVHPEKQLAGFVEVTKDQQGEPIQVNLRPACRVTGKLSSAALNNLGRSLEWTNVYVYWGNHRPISSSSKTAEFECLLPAGKYKLYGYGTDTYNTQQEIEIAEGQRELVVNLELPATRLAGLYGKPAPKLQEIKGWKNGGPVTLAELRGKVVILDFWGYWCGPCIASMPNLMELHDKYTDRGLVIIGVHDDTVGSIAEMDQKLTSARKQRWDGRDLPFLIALDGGGQTPVPGTERTARGATTAAYGISSFPTSLLIDKRGVIVKKFHPGAHFDPSELEALLDADVDEAF